MRIFSLNTFVGSPFGMPLTKSDNRFLDIISCIQRENPDIICLQEVFSQEIREGIKKALSDTHKDISQESFVPYSILFIRTFLVTTVASSCVLFAHVSWILPFIAWFFFTSSIFTFITGHNTGLVMLVSNEFYDRIQWVDHVVFDKQACDDPQNILISHGLIIAQILHPEYGHINVINTHLDAYGNGRLRQINQLILKCSQTVNVIAGDLNATQDTEEIRYLSHMLGNEEYQEPGKTWRNHGIDHIISKKNVVKNYRILEDNISDHLPVVAEI